MQGTRNSSSPSGIATGLLLFVGVLKTLLTAISHWFVRPASTPGSEPGIRRRTTGHGQRGAAMTEMVVVVPALLLLGLGAMQGALMYNAKNTVSYATFEAARKGAVNNAQTADIRNELGVRIAPLFGGDGSPEKAAKAIAQGMLEANDPGYTRIRILNPTEAAFTDFGVANEDGIVEIPNDHLRHRSRQVETSSLVNIQDANLLKIEVTYGYRLNVPLMNRVIPSVLQWADPENADFYATGRIPVTSVATVRMQSPAWPDGSVVPGGGSGGGGSVPGSGSLPGFSTETETVNADGSTTTTTTTMEPDGTITTTEETHNNDGSITTVVTVRAPDGTTSVTNDYADGDAAGGGDGSDDGNEEEELECTTTWDDEEFEFVESDGWWDVFSNMPKNLEAAYNIVKSFFEGLIDGLGSQVQGLVDILLDPGILWDVAKAAMDDPIGFVENVIGELVNDVEKLMNCGPKEIGEFIGENVQPVAFIRVIGVLTKSTRLAKYADKIETRDRDGDGDGTSRNDADEVLCDLSTSFIAGTPILTPDGPILVESITAGQRVVSRDESTYQLAPQLVTETFSRLAPTYHRLTTEFGTIEATPEHPFWVQGKGWTRVDQIESHDLVASPDGDVLILVNRLVEEPVEVYNFSVGKTPSYFAGEEQLWVHNCARTPTARVEAIDNKLRDGSWPNADNYIVFEQNGMVVLRRKDSMVGDKLHVRDGKIQVYTERVDIKATPNKQPSMSHTDLSDPKKPTIVEVDSAPGTNGPRKTVNFTDEMDRLNKERAAAIKKRDDANALPLGPERSDALNEAYKDMRKSSEAMGDLAAAAYINKTYPGAVRLESRLPGTAKQGEFDQIYLHEGRVIIVEAKGGGADWGTRRQGVAGDQIAQQGSKQYMDAVIENYQKQIDSGKVTGADAAKLQETLDALEDAKELGQDGIKYIGIKQKAGDLGVSDKIDVFDFTIGR